MNTVTHLQLDEAIRIIAFLQLLIGSLIVIIGWFIKREITTVGQKLEMHDKVIYELAGSMQRMIGRFETWNGHERRNAR